jgi:hypothetical protein
MAPIKDPTAQARIREVVATMRRDDRRAWTLGADAQWRRVEATLDGDRVNAGIDTFEVLMQAAADSGREKA